MWSDYFGPKRMCITWSTAGTLQYGPIWYWVSPIWSDLLRFGQIWFDLVIRVTQSTLDLCSASFEEIPELQRSHRATVNRRNLQCGDDSILRVNVTRDKGSPCLGAVGGLLSGGSALLVVSCSVLVSMLLCSLSMGGVALSTRLMGALRFRGSYSWLGERKGSWMVGYLCSCPGCDATRHLEH